MSAWIRIAGWTLVHFVWQGGVIAAAAAGGLRLLRSATPNARYIVASAALGAMLVSPLVTARLLSTSAATTAVLGTPRSVFSPVVAPPPVPRRGGFAPAVHGFHAPIVRLDLDRWLPIIVAAWLTGVALLLLRLTGGWWQVRRIHRAALAATASPWHAVAARLARRLTLRRVVHVVESLRVDTPPVLGWWRPAILLPVAALANLIPEQVEAILAHELAHIRRHDYLVNLLQHVTETLLFYHPAVWWISGRMRAEREQCCDAVVVHVCGDPVGYAAALVQLETERRGRAALAVAATSGSLIERVRHLLSARPPHQRPFTDVVTIAAVVVLLIVTVGGGYRWPLVVLGASGRAAQRAGTPLPRAVVVTVNGEPITDADLERRRLFKRDGPDAPLSQILVATVDERLVAQRGKQLGYALTDEQFRNVLQNLKAQNRLETDAQVQATLGQQHLTMADLRRNLELQAIVFRVQQAEVFGRVVVTDDEARRYFESHLDEFPLQLFEQARERINEQVAAANRERDWDRYLRALRNAAVMVWTRADLQRAYEEGLSQRTTRQGRANTLLGTSGIARAPTRGPSDQRASAAAVAAP